MGQEVYFSIIIPTYNREELIIECINKIKNQSFTNWECIIVNDGSTDNTKERVEQTIQDDKRFKLLNQKNSERAIARNNGAKLANGTYFIFLDSDDYFELTHLELLHQVIQADGNQIGMYFCNAFTVSNQLIEIIHKNDITSNHITSSFFLENSIIPARVCLHREIFNHFGFEPRAIIVEDTILWIEILDIFPVKYIPIDTVYYVLHDTNSVNITHNNAYLQRLKGLRLLFNEKFVGKKIPKAIKRKHLNRCFLGIYEYYYLKKNHIKAIYWLIKSILYYPEFEFKHKLKIIYKFHF